MKKKTKKIYLQTKKRYLKKIVGTSKKPRLSVFKSHKHIYAQLIDDSKGHTLAFTSTLDNELKELIIKNALDSNSKITPQKAAFLVGKKLGTLALEKNIHFVIFDRGNHLYHGRVKNVAEGAREQGLEF